MFRDRYYESTAEIDSKTLVGKYGRLDSNAFVKFLAFIAKNLNFTSVIYKMIIPNLVPTYSYIFKDYVPTYTYFVLFLPHVPILLPT